jgi:hypothetical protein
MPHFFFHIENQHEAFQDTIGIELPDASAAHQRAQKLINTVFRYMELKGGPDRRTHWVVNISDPRGRNILTVLFPKKSPRCSAYRQ